MKTVDLAKFESALLFALGEFWFDRPPRFSLARKATASDGASNILIILNGRSEPIDALEVSEAELQERTAALVRRCAQKMAYSWTKWARAQLGDHDISKALNSVPYEQLAATFPFVRWDPSDIFEKEATAP